MNQRDERDTIKLNHDDDCGDKLSLPTWDTVQSTYFKEINSSMYHETKERTTSESPPPSTWTNEWMNDGMVHEKPAAIRRIRRHLFALSDDDTTYWLLT